MAKPSKAEAWDQLTKLVKILDQHWKYTKTNSPNYFTIAGDVETALKGDHLREVTDFLTGSRKNLSDFYNSQSAKTAVLSVIRSILNDGYDAPSKGLSDTALFDELAYQMNAASETIRNRSMTFDTINAGGSNNGDGTIYRNTKDRFNQNIESGYAGEVIAEVVKDASESGITLGQEQVRIRGNADIQIDEIDLGSASAKTVNTNFRISGVQSGNGNGNFLKNGSFDDVENVNHGAVFTKNDQGSWWINTPANVKKETSEIFRFKNGEELKTTPTGTAIRFAGDALVSQYLKEENIRLTDEKNVSYFLIARYRRKSSCDGTLTLRLGSQTVTVDLTTATNDQWADLVIGTDSKGYFENFNEDWIDTSSTPNIPRGIRVTVGLSSNTTGEVIVDEIILAKGTVFEGLSYCAVAGSNTGSSSGEALKGDTWDWSDSASDTGRTQTVLARLFGRHLPHATGSETYADA